MFATTMAIEVMLRLVIDALHHVIRRFISRMTNRSIWSLCRADILCAFAPWQVLVDCVRQISAMWVIDNISGLLVFLEC